MVLTVLSTDAEEPSRAGIVTGRRVGGAVVRVRVRRRLRELVRLDRPQFRPGVWFVLVAKKRAAEVDFSTLRTEWRNLALAAGLLALAP